MSKQKYRCFVRSFADSNKLASKLSIFSCPEPEYWVSFSILAVLVIIKCNLFQKFPENYIFWGWTWQYLPQTRLISKVKHRNIFFSLMAITWSSSVLFNSDLDDLLSWALIIWRLWKKTSKTFIKTNNFLEKSSKIENLAYFMIIFQQNATVHFCRQGFLNKLKPNCHNFWNEVDF